MVSQPKKPHVVINHETTWHNNLQDHMASQLTKSQSTRQHGVTHKTTTDFYTAVRTSHIRKEIDSPAAATGLKTDSSSAPTGQRPHRKGHTLRT
jgi:hypothetical protein